MKRSNKRKAVEPGWFAPHAAIRTDGYAMLAALLRQPEAENILAIVQRLDWDETLPEKTSEALAALRRAAHDISPDALEREYNRLFVGLGAGEVVPYASWYHNGTLAASALAALRADMMRLGIVSRADSGEPEDQAGALCEIMVLLTRMGAGRSGVGEAAFFQRHVASWMGRFFNDLQSAKSADFYRSVGLFGRHFLESEKDYLHYRSERTNQEV